MTSKVEIALKSAAEQFDEPLSPEEYDEWRLDSENDHPTKKVILRRMGVISWEQACNTVGIDGITCSDHVRTSVTTAKAAIREAASNSHYTETTGNLTKSAYREHHQNPDTDTLPDDIPAPSTVAKILGDGSWKSACKRVGVSPYDADTPFDASTTKQLVRRASEDVDGELTKKKI